MQSLLALTDTQISTWVASFILPLFRITAMLMAMGMMMLSPLIISLPFKIMLFVLVDGWALIIGTLASSFGGVSP